MRNAAWAFALTLLFAVTVQDGERSAIAQDIDADYLEFLESEEARLCAIAADPDATAVELDAAQQTIDAVLRRAQAKLQLSEMVRAVFGAETLVAVTDAYTEIHEEQIGMFAGIGLGATRNQLAATIGNNQAAFQRLQDALNGNAPTDQQLAQAATLTADFEALMILHGAALAEILGVSLADDNRTMISDVVNNLGFDVIGRMIENQTMGATIAADMEFAEIPSNRVALVLTAEIHANVAACIETARLRLNEPVAGIVTDDLVTISAVLEILTPGDDCAIPPCGLYGSFGFNVWGTSISGDVTFLEPDWGVGIVDDRHIRYGTSTDDIGKIRRAELGPDNTVDAVFSVINKGQFADFTAPLDLIMTGTLEQVPDDRFPAGYQIGGSGVFSLPEEIPTDWMAFFGNAEAAAGRQVGTWRLRLTP